ncbi:dihydrolipoamide succinyltransferase, partial [Candidatus Marinamargulisbacteria bacterium SCGC AAA071-K20]
MKKDIVVPAAGESVTEADIASWHKASGDYVKMDEPIVELETDKASMDLAAEISGILDITVEDGETVDVGQVIGSITEADAPSEPATGTKEASKTEEKKTETAPKAESATAGYADKHPSPAAAKLSAEKGINLSNVSGSGKDGRITKTDVANVPTQPAKVEQKFSTPVAAAPAGERSTRTEKMSRLRKTVMNRLLQAQATSAMLTTFNEVDMTAVMDIRKKYKDAFKEKNEVGLGFMSFFTKAACRALQDFPIMNAQVNGEQIVYNNFCDVGVAIATPKGLVVPVIRNAETLNFKDIESSIVDFAIRGRAGKLTLDDMNGGTFTITNGGTFGSMMSTPILNIPQSAILGMHNIIQRPMAVNGEVKIRPMMYLAVTYDHRIIDGSDAVRFLVRIKECLEDPTR